MAITLEYQSTTWTGNDIKAGTVSMEMGLLSDELAADYMVLDIRSDTDLTGTFAEGVPLTLKHNSVVIGKYYNPKVTRTAYDMYRVEAYSAIMLLDKDYHPGGIYSGQLASTVIAQLMSGIPYGIDTSLSGKTLTGWLPYAKRRDNLRQVLFVIGAVIRRNTAGALVIQPLSGDTIGTIGSNRAYDRGFVTKTQKVTRVEVTEHKYTADNEQVTILSESVTGTQTIIFPEPYHSLAITNGTITESGVNYAKISGSGTVTLTGKKYKHLTRLVTHAGGAPAGAEKVVRVSDATLINTLNAAGIAERIFEFGQCDETVTQDFLFGSERPGDIVSVAHPYGGISSAAAVSFDLRLSGKIKASGNFLVGFTPYDGGNYYDEYDLLTTSGTYTVPAGTTKIHVVLIDGGNGGTSGGNGGNGVSNWVNYQQGATQIIVSYGTNYGQGGSAGVKGRAGKVYEFDLDVTPGQQIPYTIGAAGSSNGGAGGHTTMSGRSGADGTHYPDGYMDLLTGQTYAKDGIDGVAGARGGSGYNVLSPYGGYSGQDVSPNTGGPGGTGQGGSGTYSTWYLAGAGGGGAAKGANGSAGGSTTYSGGVYYAGKGGNGATPVAPSPPPATQYGSGGNGGHGGGGAGANGAGTSYSASGATQQIQGNSSYGVGGTGSAGTPGVKGCIIIYR
jgi:hypothetical protein